MGGRVRVAADGPRSREGHDRPPLRDVLRQFLLRRRQADHAQQGVLQVRPGRRLRAVQVLRGQVRLVVQGRGQGRQERGRRRQGRGQNILRGRGRRQGRGQERRLVQGDGLLLGTRAFLPNCSR